MTTGYYVPWRRFGFSNLCSVVTLDWVHLGKRDGDNWEQMKDQVGMEMQTITIVSALFLSISLGALFADPGFKDDMNRTAGPAPPASFMHGDVPPYVQRMLWHTLLCISSLFAMLAMLVALMIDMSLRIFEDEQGMQIFLQELGCLRMMHMRATFVQMIFLIGAIAHFFGLKYPASGYGCIPVCVLLMLGMVFAAMGIVHAVRVSFHVRHEQRSNQREIFLSGDGIATYLDKYVNQAGSVFQVDKGEFLSWLPDQVMKESCENVSLSATALKLAGLIFDRLLDAEMNRECENAMAYMQKRQAGSKLSPCQPGTAKSEPNASPALEFCQVLPNVVQ